MSECLKCKGTGEILLFISRVPCECLTPAPVEEVCFYGVHHNVVVKKGSLLRSQDLNVSFSDREGPVNPAHVHYEISHLKDDGSSVSIPGDLKRVPENPAVGEYYAPLYVPPTAIGGTYGLRWVFRKTAGSRERHFFQPFVVGEDGMP